MKSIQTWFDEYGESHRNPTNKLIHFICVPLIFFSIIGLFVSIPSGILQNLLPDLPGAVINFGTIVLLLGLLFYLRLSFQIFIGMGIFSILVLWLLNLISVTNLAPLWEICLFIFVAAWIGQFYGHKVEKKKPAFFKDLQFLLIGPAWILGFIYRRIGIKY